MPHKRRDVTEMGLFKGSDHPSCTCKLCQKEFPPAEINKKAMLCTRCLTILTTDTKRFTETLAHYTKQLQEQTDTIQKINTCMYLLETCYEQKFRYTGKGLDELAGIENLDDVIFGILNQLASPPADA